MLNLAIMVPSWLMSLLFFQFTYLHQMVTQTFSNITPARIHQTLEATLVNETIQLFISPVKTTQVITLLFSKELNRVDLDYELSFLYFNEAGSSYCLDSCWAVDIHLTYSIYDMELTSYVRYQLQRNEN
jgi:hypothetical protein